MKTKYLLLFSSLVVALTACEVKVNEDPSVTDDLNKKDMVELWISKDYDNQKSNSLQFTNAKNEWQKIFTLAPTETTIFTLQPPSMITVNCSNSAVATTFLWTEVNDAQEVIDYRVVLQSGSEAIQAEAGKKYGLVLTVTNTQGCQSGAVSFTTIEGDHTGGFSIFENDSMEPTERALKISSDYNNQIPNVYEFSDSKRSSWQEVFTFTSGSAQKLNVYPPSTMSIGCPSYFETQMSWVELDEAGEVVELKPLGESVSTVQVKSGGHYAVVVDVSNTEGCSSGAIAFVVMKE